MTERDLIRIFRAAYKTAKAGGQKEGKKRGHPSKLGAGLMAIYRLQSK